jgi:hypothetical protein
MLNAIFVTGAVPWVERVSVIVEAAPINRLPKLRFDGVTTKLD